MKKIILTLLVAFVGFNANAQIKTPQPLEF